MSRPRRSFSAVPLLDGRVLVVGDASCGEGDTYGTEGSERAELLDPATGRWTPAESLNAPRDGFMAVRLLDGRVLVTGGVNRHGVPFSSTKLFDPATGHWAASGLLNQARWRAAGALLSDGRVLVASGTSAELYDPATGLWTKTGSLHRPRHEATAHRLPDGRVLVLGGWDFDPATGQVVEPAVELYDPDTGRWTVVGRLRSPRGTPVVLDDGSLLFIGGSIRDEAAGLVRPSSTVWRFDPATGISTHATPMPAGRMGGSATRLDDGRVLIAGGADQAFPLNPEAPGVRRTAAALVYDPALDAWVQAAPMPFADDPMRAVLIADGSVVVLGGTLPEESVSTGGGDCVGNPVAWVARFTPATTVAP